MFPSDRAKIKSVEDGYVTYLAMANGMETKTLVKTFEKYWKKSEMLVK